jgi:hypothetical protein
VFPYLSQFDRQGVGNGSRRPRPPNRACGFPAHGSPVGSFRIGIGLLHTSRNYGEQLLCRQEGISYLPPMTPLPSAANMRSFHAEAFTHDRSRSWVTAPCIVPSDTNSASLSLCLCVKLTHPPSCLPSLDAAFSALFAAYHRYGTMKALTPAQLTCRAGLPTYLATPSCRSVSNHVGCLNIASPTTPTCPASFGLRHE